MLIYEDPILKQEGGTTMNMFEYVIMQRKIQGFIQNNSYLSQRLI